MELSGGFMRKTTTWIGYTPKEKRFIIRECGVTVALKQVGIGRGPVSNPFL